jgi:hypothetical protein
MNRIKYGLVAALICWGAGALSGCTALPTQVNTYQPVNKYFQLKDEPYTISFGREQRWGPITAWPIAVTPLDFRDEFARNFSGRYLVFVNKAREWQVADEKELENLLKYRNR